MKRFRLPLNNLSDNKLIKIWYTTKICGFIFVSLILQYGIFCAPKNHSIMKQLFILFLILSMGINMVASDDLNGDKNRNVIDITQTTPPKPQIMVDDPVAEYNTATGTLTVTLGPGFSVERGALFSATPSEY